MTEKELILKQATIIMNLKSGLIELEGGTLWPREIAKRLLDENFPEWKKEA